MGEQDPKQADKAGIKKIEDFLKLKANKSSEENRLLTQAYKLSGIVSVAIKELDILTTAYLAWTNAQSEEVKQYIGKSLTKWKLKLRDALV